MCHSCTWLWTPEEGLGGCRCWKNSSLEPYLKKHSMVVDDVSTFQFWMSSLWSSWWTSSGTFEIPELWLWLWNLQWSWLLVREENQQFWLVLSSVSHMDTFGLFDIPQLFLKRPVTLSFYFASEVLLPYSMNTCPCSTVWKKSSVVKSLACDAFF